MTTHEGEANTAPSDTSSVSASMEPSPMLQDQTLPLSGIEDPNDTDVLCGRGGAALRHPGNQTYRRLVHLNKGLYITCLKAEKLKISRSIVAAIREQNGRFLEKKAEKGTWYDIGDKKAMEKTSQALREGQPKLRQKIVELGGGAAGAAALLETQFPSSSSMDSQPNQLYPGGAYNAGSGSGFGGHSAAAVAAARVNNGVYGHHNIAPAMAPASLHSLTGSPGMNNMPPRPSLHDMSSPEYMQRLSRSGDEDQQQQQQRMMHPSLTPRGAAAAMALGVSDATLTIMNSFSNFGMQDSSSMSMEQAAAAARGMQFQQEQQQQHHQDEEDESLRPRPIRPRNGNDKISDDGGGHDHSDDGGGHDHSDDESDSENDQCSDKAQKFDRRRVFAKMKFNKPESGRGLSCTREQQSGRSLGDTMSDVHVNEAGSLMSNMTGSTMEDHNNNNVHSKVPTVAEVFGGGSRRSIVSGMSKTSDADNSIFSDLSKKIGNVSTRSLLSDISGMDEGSVDVSIDTRDMPTPTTAMEMDDRPLTPASA